MKNNKHHGCWLLDVKKGQQQLVSFQGVIVARSLSIPYTSHDPNIPALGSGQINTTGQ